MCDFTVITAALTTAHVSGIEIVGDLMVNIAENHFCFALLSISQLTKLFYFLKPIMKHDTETFVFRPDLSNYHRLMD